MTPSAPAAILTALSTVAASFLLAACGGSPGGGSASAGNGASAPKREMPRVVCTTPMVGDLVRSVAGDAGIEVVVLVAPGVDPHLWTPTRTEVVEILECDALFLNGLMLEGRAGEAFARVEQSGRPVVRVAETLPKADLALDPANSSYFDPHVWMDPQLWAKTAPAVAEGLSKVLPAKRETFVANAGRFASDSAALDAEIRTAMGTVPFASRTLVTAHDAFGYFGRRYDLRVRGLQGISTESEPSLADIEALVAFLSDERVPAVFTETTVSDRGLRALVEGCAARGHELRLGPALYSDSLARPTVAEGTWAGMMRHNAKSIVEALGGRW
jgi:manganese/zinc/iron transport system substrate-binding protein